MPEFESIYTLEEAEARHTFAQALKKPVPIRVTRMDHPFMVDTRVGLVSGEAGDYLAVGVEGEMYPIRASVFEATYDLLPELT